MNAILLTGKVVSQVKVINTNNGTPLCRFTLESDGRKFNCLIAGKKAYKFVYEVDEGAVLSIDARANERMQLVLNSYKVRQSPGSFGYTFDYKGRQLPHRKAAYK